MTEHEERENFIRNSISIVDHSNETFKELFEHHLQREGINLYQFIDSKQHEIYHLCYNTNPCSMCPSGSKRPIYSYRNRVLNIPQLKLLLDLKSNVPCRFPASSPTACCFTVNPKVNLDDFDQTLIRCILVNLTKLIPDGSPERLAVEDLVKIRNESYGYANIGRISNHDYQIYKSRIERNILTLAQLFGKEDEFKKKFKEAEVRPLDQKLYEKYQAESRKKKETMEKLESIHSSFGAAIDAFKSDDCSASLSAGNFIEELKDRTVLEGQDVELECKVLDDATAVEWLKNGIKIEGSKKFKILKRDQSHSLEILKVEMEDAGEYAIRVNNQDNRASLFVESYFTEETKDIEVTEGHDIRFKCKVKDENGIAEWFKDGLEITNAAKIKPSKQGKRHFLDIWNVGLEDEGDYSVVINNRERQSKLLVKGYFTRNLRDATFLEGVNAFLDCDVIEKDTVAKWYKDDIEIHSGSTEKYRGHHLATYHKLDILHIDPSDAGCYSVNINGRSRTSNLSVTEYFTKPLKDIEVFESQEVLLECEIFEPGAIPLWLKDGTEIKSKRYNIESNDKCHSLKIENADVTDCGKYTIRIKHRQKEAQVKVKEAEDELEKERVEKQEGEENKTDMTEEEEDGR